MMNKSTIDNGWKKQLRALHKNCTYAELASFVKQQKEFSEMIGFNKGIKEGLYEKKKNKKTMKELFPDEPHGFMEFEGQR